MNCIYVCHSYGRSHGLTGEQCKENVKKSIEWGRKLIKLGFNPFVPNLFHYLHTDWEDSPDEDVYLDLVMDWLTKCDAVFVAEMPTWSNSGVKREIALAKTLNIPVFYSLEELM